MDLKKLELVVKGRLEAGPVKGLFEAMQRGRDGRARAVQEFEDYEKFRSEVRRIKERCISKLPELVELFRKNAERRGAQVHTARDAREANEIIARIVSSEGAKTVVKSKSLTSEEIELNKYLEAGGIRVVETDLGERIIQLAGERPSHLVFPAVHKTRQEVAHLFSSESGEGVGAEMEEIMRYVRKRLRSDFLEAEVGITGANVGIAENGAVILETNEGNGRLVSSLPRVQIVVMGIEKIVETIEDALYMIRAHPVAATGQRLTTYVSIMTGRLPLTGSSDERQLHIILLDNGRSRMREDGWFKEALYCIRCGACMNVCSPYSVVGGHIFGYIYPGPIGIPWTANVHGLDKAVFSHLCVSCGLCHVICPVDIDIPMMISRVKELDAEVNGFPRINKMMMGYERLGKLASATSPLSNWVIRRRITRIIMELLLGIERSRPLPRFTRRTFTKRFKKRSATFLGSPTRKVVLFVDFYANYCEPELAEIVLDALLRAGVEVEVPEQLTSGYPFIAYGDLKTAKRYSEKNVRSLIRYVNAGYDVVSLEPTATYALRYSYPKLLNDANSRIVSSRTYEVFEYLRALLDKDLIRVELVKGGVAGLHVPCHQRALSSGRDVLYMFRRVGGEIRVVETGMCCGMAGTFGLKKGPIGYELSERMGNWLFNQFKVSGVSYILTESSVCKIQLEQGTGMEVLHPLKVLRFTSTQ